MDMKNCQKNWFKENLLEQNRAYMDPDRAIRSDQKLVQIPNIFFVLLFYVNKTFFHNSASSIIYNFLLSCYIDFTNGILILKKKGCLKWKMKESKFK